MFALQKTSINTLSACFVLCAVASANAQTASQPVDARDGVLDCIRDKIAPAMKSCEITSSPCVSKFFVEPDQGGSMSISFFGYQPPELKSKINIAVEFTGGMYQMHPEDNKYGPFSILRTRLKDLDGYERAIIRSETRKAFEESPTIERDAAEGEESLVERKIGLQINSAALEVQNVALACVARHFPPSP
jgi:hypothetical protein